MKLKAYEDANELKIYFKEISKLKRLSRDEENELIRKAQNGDKISFNQVVEANLKFVVSTAKKFTRFGIPYQDLISEGNLGLMHAINKFDTTRGTKFITYAVWWIKNSMRELCNKYSVESNDSSLENYKTDIVDEEETCCNNSLVDNESENNLIINKSREDAINDLLSNLKDREVRILKMYYGLDGKPPMTLKEIADSEGNIVEERTRQILSRALEKLKCNVLISNDFDSYKELY